MDEEQKCNYCAGAGHYGSRETCYWCKGRGKISNSYNVLSKQLKQLENEYSVLDKTITETILKNTENLSFHHEKLRNLTEARKIVLETIFLLIGGKNE